MQDLQIRRPKMTTRSSTLFLNSLVLIDEADRRVIDILTRQQDEIGQIVDNTTRSSTVVSYSSHRPANWTASDISLRTINNDRVGAESLIDGIPGDPKSSRFLNFRRNEDFVRTLIARPGGIGRRRTTFYTDARTSVASFFTACDENGVDDPDTNEADISGERLQSDRYTGIFGTNAEDDKNRSMVELFSIPHPDDVVPVTEPEQVADIALTQAIPDTTYLDRFWASLFPSVDKAKPDGSWIVAVSLDMSRWFVSNLSSLMTRTTSLLGASPSPPAKEGDHRHGFPSQSPMRQPIEDDYDSIPLSPTTMALRELPTLAQSSDNDDEPIGSRLGLWYIQDDGSTQRIWAGGTIGEAVRRDGAER